MSKRIWPDEGCRHPGDVEIEKACKTLRRAADAAENANHAGEVAVWRAVNAIRDDEADDRDNPAFAAERLISEAAELLKDASEEQLEGMNDALMAAVFNVTAHIGGTHHRLAAA